MIRHVSSRDCPNCRSTVTIMRLRYSSRLSTINGVCGNCDYSIKWLMLGGNESKRARLNPAGQIVENEAKKEREVLRS